MGRSLLDFGLGDLEPTGIAFRPTGSASVIVEVGLQLATWLADPGECLKG